VAEVRNNEVYLRYPQAYLAEESSWTTQDGNASLRRASTTGGKEPKSAAEKVEVEARERALTESAIPGPADFRVPLAEEEVTVETRVRDLGVVRVHKRVVVQQKQITVPLAHEELQVERVVIDGGAATVPGEGLFVENTFSIPLHEEEVDIHKRTFVREEVRLHKQTLHEELTTTTEARREEIDIEEPVLYKERMRRAG